MTPRIALIRACLPAALLVACGGGDASPQDTEGTSTSSSSGDDVGPPTTTSTMTTVVTTNATSTTTSETTSPADESSSDSGTTGEPIGSCADDPEAPGDQGGDPLALHVWPNAFVDDLAFDADERLILSARHEQGIQIGTQTFERLEVDAYVEGFLTIVGDDGEPVWFVPIHGDGGSSIIEVGVDDTGVIVAGGDFLGELAIGDASLRTIETEAWNGWIGQFDTATGALAWVRTIVQPATDARGEVTEVVMTGDGGAFVVFSHEAGEWVMDPLEGGDELVFESAGGVAFMRFDGAGALLWMTLAQATPDTLFDVSWGGATRVADGFAAGLHAEGPIDIGGDIYVDPEAPPSAHLVRFAEDGTVVRDDLFAFAQFADVVVAPCDDVIAVGYSNTGSDGLPDGGFAARVTTDGGLRWATKIIGTGEVGIDPFGQIGVYHGVSNREDSFAISKLDHDGGIMWTQEAATGYFGLSALAVHPKGAVFAGGYFGVSLTIDGLAPPPMDGGFILELKP